MKSVTRTRRRQAASSTDAVRPVRVAFYIRVSTDDQEERGTIGAQRNYLYDKYRPDFRDDAPLPMVLFGEYADDGWSGALPLRDRPSGARLLADAAEHKFDVVIIYKLDRLGRKARVLLDAHDELEQYGVAITSATEPFDTRPGPMQAIGRFVFQLLASIAELDRATIETRTMNGKHRVAREGRFVNGAVPFGFEVDEHDTLVPSSRPVSTLSMTEADLVRKVFERVAAGESCYALADWLNAAGVPSTRRLFNKEHRRLIEITATAQTQSPMWSNQRVWWMIRNPAYKGERTLNFDQQSVDQAIEPIVSVERWDEANARVRTNNRWSGEHDGWTYLLSKKITCDAELDNGERCGMTYTGGASNGYRYYGCNGNDKANARRRGVRCPARMLRAEKVEELVWRDLDWQIRHHEQVLEELRATIRERQGQSTSADRQREELRRRRDDLSARRLKLRIALREALRPYEECEQDLAANAQAIAVLDSQLATLDASLEVTAALEHRLAMVAPLLRQLETELDDIAASDDRVAKRRLMDLLVGEIHVSDPRSRDPELEVSYLFAPEGTTRPGPAERSVDLRLQSGCSPSSGFDPNLFLITHHLRVA